MINLLPCDVVGIAVRFLCPWFTFLLSSLPFLLPLFSPSTMHATLHNTDLLLPNLSHLHTLLSITSPFVLVQDLPSRAWIGTTAVSRGTPHSWSMTSRAVFFPGDLMSCLCLPSPLAASEPSNSVRWPFLLFRLYSQSHWPNQHPTSLTQLPKLLWLLCSHSHCHLTSSLPFCLASVCQSCEFQLCLLSFSRCPPPCVALLAFP